jgi:hypothetical protein
MPKSLENLAEGARVHNRIVSHRIVSHAQVAARGEMEKRRRHTLPAGGGTKRDLMRSMSWSRTER